MLRKQIQRVDWNPWLANVQLSRHANITLPGQYTYSLLNKHITAALFTATHTHTHQDISDLQVCKWKAHSSNAQLASLHEMKYVGGSAHWPQFWCKEQGVGVAGQTPPLDPPLQFKTSLECKGIIIC